jgi:hypothetical protein
MKLAQCADALHVARRCRIGASNFTWIEVKIGHSALQEMRRIRTAFRRGAQLGGRHGNIPRHPLHVGFPAECKIRSVSCLDAVSTPLQHGCKWAVFSMGRSKHATPFLEAVLMQASSTATLAGPIRRVLIEINSVSGERGMNGACQ